jgi:hypothetical protein
MGRTRPNQQRAGHYRPPPQLAAQAGLPLASFVEVQFT